MFKKTCTFLILVMVGLSGTNITFAKDCKIDGYTVVFVNGIFNSEKEAREGREDLERRYLALGKLNDVVFRLGYNPSHIEGLGDVAQVVSQVLGSSMNDFDLKTILMQIHSEITTQKILLVGHSQGTFYTNEMYNYLTTHGVSKESIAVYNIATPASFVSGDGKYLTSGNDNLINKVRGWTAAVKAPQPLPANILIPLSSPETEGLWRGHGFAREYLMQGSGIIISDIESLLNGLSTRSDMGLGDGCYKAPVGTFSYKMQKFGFALSDPFAQTVRGTIAITGKAITAVGSGITSGVAIVIDAVGDVLSGVNSSNSSFEQGMMTQNTASIGVSVTSQPEEQVEAKTKLVAERDVVDEIPEIIKPIIQPGEKEKIEEDKTDKLVVEKPTIPKGPRIPKLIPVNTPYPGFGGGAPPQTKEETVVEVVLPVITIVSPSDFSSLFATTSITFTGTSTPLSVVSTDFSVATTSADNGGSWELILSEFTQGTTTVQFTATDSENVSSESTSVSLVVDTVSPEFSSFSISQCTYSLYTGGCLSSSTEVGLSWISTSTDISYYSVVLDGSVSATTTNVTSTLALSNGSTFSVEIVAYDVAGNNATSSSQSVEVYEMPVVINEIAWAGTEASATDEWIELYNRTSYTIDLTNAVLYAEDFGPYLSLSGTISSGGYYLIERSNGSTTSVAEDLAVVFSGINGASSGFGNVSGERLLLVQSLGGNATSTLDATPATVDCGGWCGGEATTTPISMERKDPDISGGLVSNWDSHNMSPRNGTDVDGNEIYGTPKSVNSVSGPPPPPGGGTN